MCTTYLIIYRPEGLFAFPHREKRNLLTFFPSFFLSFSRFLLLPEVIIKTVQVDKTTHGLCRKRSTIIERATNTRRFTVTYNMDWKKKKKKKILADSTPKTHQHEAQTREKTLSNFCFSNSFASRSLAHSVDNYLFFRITDERTRKMFSQLAIGVSRLLLVPINT